MRTRQPSPQTEDRRDAPLRRPSPAVQPILALQRTAGNQAVARFFEERRQERTDDRRDERTRREDERDELLRRPEGGDGSNSDFNHDWAGRAILERYLLGEGDWDIVDEPGWSEYMKASALLSMQLAEKLEQLIAIECANGVEGDFAIDQSFPAEIDNGEGIVGYQYLHGTHKDVGGFGIAVTGTITRTGNACAVSANVAYTWNDLIDPNGQYTSDIIKSTFAELITLGMATSYRLSITWNEPLTAQVDEAGTVTLSGYPALAAPTAAPRSP
jgi:hypothetical protein